MSRDKDAGRSGGVAELRGERSYISLDNGTTWPTPSRAEELEWLLRYSEMYGQGRPLTSGEALTLASVCSAYSALVLRPEIAQTLPKLRAALRALTSDSSPSETEKE